MIHAAIKHAFNQAATTYNDAADIQRVIADDLILFADALSIEPTRILELGSGTGYLSQQLIQTFPNSTLYLTDCAIDMLAISQRNNTSAHIAAYGEALPFATQSQDLIISNLMLQWCHSEQIFNEAYRVLNHGGHFIATTLGPHTLHTLAKLNIVNPFQTRATLRRQLTQFKHVSLEAKIYRSQPAPYSTILRNLTNIGSTTLSNNPIKLSTYKQIRHLSARTTYEAIVIHAIKG